MFVISVSRYLDCRLIALQLVGVVITVRLSLRRGDLEPICDTNRTFRCDAEGRYVQEPSQG